MSDFLSGTFITVAATLRLIVDFEGVPVMSSSFADEVFGKLFLKMGQLNLWILSNQ